MESRTTFSPSGVEDSNYQTKYDELESKYRERIIGFVRLQTLNDLPFNFVHKVLEATTIKQGKKDWGQLGDQLTDGSTALHKAAELDKSDDSSILQLICHLMRNGIETQKMKKDQVANLISKTNSKNETCLHLALMWDLDVGEELIDLAEAAIFMKQSENGNTPLHDALEFPIDDMAAKSFEHRFLVPSPTCGHEAIYRPLDERVQLRNKTQPQACCERCERFMQKYRKFKENRYKIIYKLLDRCPKAITVPNEDGMPPFNYHILAHEEFKKKYPDFNMPTTQSKQTPSEQITSITKFKALMRGTAYETLGDATHGYRFSGQQTVGDMAGTGGQPLSSNEEGARRANIGASIMREDSGTRDPTEEQNGQMEQSEACSSNKPQDCYLLSANVEALLWEAAFSIGGYEDARQCLFWSREFRREKSTEAPTADEEKQRILIPTGRVTTNTIEVYKHWTFEPTLAYVHLRLTPNPTGDNDSPKTPEERDEWRTESSNGLKMLFDWLKGKKQVKRVLKLVVEDNFMFPCSEAIIRNCLKCFDDIRYLDWRRPNISPGTLLEAKQVVELSLYSTGINAIFSSWGDLGGLQKLQMLRRIYLDARKVGRI